MSTVLILWFFCLHENIVFDYFKSEGLFMNEWEYSIIKSAKLEYELHPQADIFDLYKFFYQGLFGPGHLITDIDSANNNLLFELENAKDFDSCLFQVAGFTNCYYRVNLSIINDGLITVDDFFRAFINSADEVVIPQRKYWKNLWIKIKNLLIKNFDLNLSIEDENKMEVIFDSNDMICHHSDLYRALYHPHYRLISRNQIQKNPQLLRKVADLNLL